MNTKTQKILDPKTLVLTAMLSAVAGVLMSIDFPLPLMPPFYKMEFSDIPTVIATFLMGPVSGICVEICKQIIKLLAHPTTTMYIGELANLIAITLFVPPLWMFFKRSDKSQRSFILALCFSIVIRTAFACFVNVFISLPLFAKAQGISVDSIVQMVAKINPAIHDLNSFVILGTIPFNVFKLALNYALAAMLYNNLKKTNLFSNLIIRKGSIRA